MTTTSLHLHLPLPRVPHGPRLRSRLSLSSPSLALDSLHRHLSAANFLQADHETRRLLIQLAGEAAEKRGYVFFSEVQFIAPERLRAIDDLWRGHSEGRFGYSVQRRVWERAQRDFTKFFVEVGWMRRMESEVEQFTYRWFPGEFVWELGEGTPEGHLPLTNALRGTQLLGSLLTHPAFDGEEEEGLSSKRVKKTDYSF